MLFRSLLALAAVILAAVLVLLALFQAELRTLNTIERVDDTDLFTMTYLGDYGLDDFLAQGGASNDNELLDFLMQKLLKGLPLHFDIPDLGCSTFAAETPEGDAIFGRNFDMYYSPALFVRTAPEDGYRSISMVNLSYIGFGEGKLPTSLLDSLLTLAVQRDIGGGQGEQAVQQAGGQLALPKADVGQVDHGEIGRASCRERV